MIYTKIVCSLLSASWMSAVSAVLNDTQMETILALETRTEIIDDWTAAYYDVQPFDLDNYFMIRVYHLGDMIANYILDLDPQAIPAEILPPRPGRSLKRALVRVRKLVFLIWYSNLRILNDMKQRALGYIQLHPLLGVIDDEYVGSMPIRYHGPDIRSEQPTVWIEAATIDIAVLFSLNKAMLDRNSKSRLRKYQDLIKQMHTNMSEYMRSQIEVPYSWVIQRLGRVIGNLKGIGVYGFANPRIQHVLEKLSDAILGVIVIFGGGGMDGRTMLFNLLEPESGWAIRRKLGLEPRFFTIEEWSRALLTSLRDALRLTPWGDHEGHRNWFQELLPLVRRLMALGGEESGTGAAGG